MEVPDEVLQQYLDRYALDVEDMADFPKLAYLLKDKAASDAFIVKLRAEIQRQQAVIENLQAALLEKFDSRSAR